MLVRRAAVLLPQLFLSTLALSYPWEMLVRLITPDGCQPFIASTAGAVVVVADWMLQVVVLVIFLSRIEGLGLFDFCRNIGISEFFPIQFLLGCLGQLELLIVVGENF